MLTLTSLRAAARACAVACALALVVAPTTARAATRATQVVQVVQVGLTPTTGVAGVPLTAQLTVRSSACTTVAALGVGVRDAQDNNLDFPGNLTDQEICPSGITFTSGARSFDAGRYRMFGFYQDQAGAWHNLAEQTLTIEAPRVVQDRLTPTTATADTSTTAQLTVHATACMTVAVLGVGVRDADDDNLDFPGSLTDQQICPDGVTLTTQGRTFPAGRYRMFGFYQDQAGVWHNLAEQTLTVSGTPPQPPRPPGPTSPIPGTKLAWSDEFDGPLNAERWNNTKTNAYKYGDHNPNDDKLDRINPANVTVADGVATFTARPGTFRLPNGRTAWETGLLTTEGTREHFQVRAGDYVETRVRLPEEDGAWPALWSWREGDHEIDSFEYHPDNGDLLELTSHIATAQKYVRDRTAIKPGEWVTIGTYYGASSTVWYLNGKPVFADGKGVGRGFHADLILNLSICSGNYHPDPDPDTTSISFDADYVRVFR
ncbi:hypothetical protein PUR71_11295 [Streptomyces sp. SP17BM10]|uniref:glycoside hydrolase family 16 protein n=1 Tax=Streptomyces sp. SP17BM10 TaxID=3002530 RepID=UPI002E7907B5|nr:hypothetical protein [Streptomyces sp. SP17BM10]MEE1783487.1 hypothetical protein [Streptomyces sp. SP17BM10]